MPENYLYQVTKTATCREQVAVCEGEWGLLGEAERREVAELGLGVEAGAVFGDPGEVAVAEDLGVWVVGLQASEECQQGVLLSGGTGVAGVAVFIEAAFVADADGVGIVALGMGTGDLLWAAGMELAVLRDVIVVAGGPEAPGLVTGLKGFDREVLGELRG